MKLYFYIYNNYTHKMEITECEVKETKKMYKLLDKVDGYYYPSVNKDNVDSFYTMQHGTLILIQRNNAYALKKFETYYENEQKRLSDWHKKLQQELEDIRSSLNGNT